MSTLSTSTLSTSTPSLSTLSASTLSTSTPSSSTLSASALSTSTPSSSTLSASTLSTSTPSSSTLSASALSTSTPSSSTLSASTSSTNKLIDFFNKDDCKGLKELCAGGTAIFTTKAPKEITGNFTRGERRATDSNIFHQCIIKNSGARLESIAAGIREAEERQLLNTTDLGLALNAKCGEGKTPLDLSVEYNYQQATKYFLEWGANILSCNANTQSRITTDEKTKEIFENYQKHKNELAKSIKAKQYEAAYGYRFVIDTPDLKDDPIHCALKNGADKTKSPQQQEKDVLDLIKYLIRKGCDVNKQNLNSHTPLYLAVKKNYLTVVRYLVKEAEVDKTLSDKEGNTVLHIAAREGFAEVLRVLLKGADPDFVDTQNKLKKTPLHLANKLAIVKMLHARGADFRIVDRNGHKPVLFYLDQPEAGQLVHYAIPFSDITAKEESRLKGQLDNIFWAKHPNLSIGKKMAEVVVRGGDSTGAYANLANGTLSLERTIEKS